MNSWWRRRIQSRLQLLVLALMLAGLPLAVLGPGDWLSWYSRFVVWGGAVLLYYDARRRKQTQQTMLATPSGSARRPLKAREWAVIAVSSMLGVICFLGLIGSASEPWYEGFLLFGAVAAASVFGIARIALNRPPLTEASDAARTETL